MGTQLLESVPEGNDGWIQQGEDKDAEEKKGNEGERVHLSGSEKRSR